MSEINVLSLSYGKDSLACLGACEKLGWKIDRIIHAEVWATDEISADLPPMLEFKKKADAIIKERYGLEVEHVCAIAKDGTKQTYEKLFYHVPKRRGRERERRKTSWISPSQRKLVYIEPQKISTTAFQSQSVEGIGVRNSRYCQGSIKGFPGTAIATWCKNLKVEAMRFPIGSPR